MRDDDLLKDVKQYYAKRADKAACCVEACCCSQSADSMGLSLGCGDPLSKAGLTSGEDVLDIGSGAGKEVIRAAQIVSPSGIAYGLDATDEMLNLALLNRKSASAWNAVFIRGTMENIPLPAECVDVVISNCVINLSADKQAVSSEIYRVLRPMGRLAISDTLVAGTMPDALKQDRALWCECVSGALSADEYTALLTRAGFRDIRIEIEEAYDRFSIEEHGFQLKSAFISGIKRI